MLLLIHSNSPHSILLTHRAPRTHFSFAYKDLQKFMHFDELRGVPFVNLETDPMGLGLPTAVLGVDVATAVKRSPDSRWNIPTFLLQAVRYIDMNVTEEGLYRIPGGAKRINELCFVANRGHELVLDLGDVEACCSVVVRWLRTLPEGQGLLWNSTTQSLRAAVSGAKGEERKIFLRQAINLLPPENSATLLFLAQHFKRVADAENKMTLANLDICIPGNLDVQSLVTFGPWLWDNFSAPCGAFTPRSDQVHALQGHRLQVRSPTITVVPSKKDESNAESVPMIAHAPLSPAPAEFPLESSSSHKAIPTVSPRPAGMKAGASLTSPVTSPRVSAAPSPQPRVSPVPSPRISHARPHDR